MQLSIKFRERAIKLEVLKAFIVFPHIWVFLFNKVVSSTSI